MVGDYPSGVREISMKARDVLCWCIAAYGAVGLLVNGFILVYVGAVKPLSDFNVVQMLKTIANLEHLGILFLAIIAIQMIGRRQ